MVCSKNRLVMEVKSGEARGFGFTIKNKSEILQPDGTYYTPMDLTNYTVQFQVKKYPYFSVQSIIDKIVTTEEDMENGWIYNPEGGQFKVELTLEDLNKLIPSQDYYVIITLLNGNQRIIISGEGDKSGILRFCKS